MLGVGRHAHDDSETDSAQSSSSELNTQARSVVKKVYLSNPELPDRWTPMVPARIIAQTARTVTDIDRTDGINSAPASRFTGRGNTVYICGTMDTKGDELHYMRDIVRAAGIRVQIVDLSTSGKPSGSEVTPNTIASFHPRGASGVFTGDRGSAVAGMTLAFERWMAKRQDVAGVLAAGGSGGTALVAPAFRLLPVGIPKLIVSTVASGNTAQYVGSSDMVMMHSVADVQGLNSITRVVLKNAAKAIAGMAAKPIEAEESPEDKPAIGLTMFGVTTPCVSMVSEQLSTLYDCLTFHATGTGGRSMEKLMQKRSAERGT